MRSSRRRTPVRAAMSALLFAALLTCLSSAVSSAQAQIRRPAIVGRVVLSGSGAPVEGAEVRLKDTEHRTVTSESGLFQLESLPAGNHVLTVHYLGLQSEEFPVRISGRETIDVTFRLETKVLPVAELVVTVDQSTPVSKLTGFYRRLDNRPGYFLTRADIEALPTSRTTDLLRRVPGLDVSPRNLAGRSPVRMGRRKDCFPRFYIDGAYAGYYHPNDLQPGDIAGIEIYRGNSEVPIRFKHGDRCGVIVVWTRDPGNARSFD